MSDELDPEDAKLVVLARAARLRAHAPAAEAEGAALRDEDGRTYSAGTLAVPAEPSLAVSALAGAASAAASSGARALEAAVLVTDRDGPVRDADLAVVRVLGAGVPVLVCGPDGALRDRTST